MLTLGVFYLRMYTVCPYHSLAFFVGTMENGRSEEAYVLDSFRKNEVKLTDGQAAHIQVHFGISEDDLIKMKGCSDREMHLKAIQDHFGGPDYSFNKLEAILLLCFLT